MAISPEQLSRIHRRVRAEMDNWAVLATVVGGSEALDQEAIGRLVASGILAPDTLAQIQAGEMPDILGDALVTGMMLGRLEEAGTDAADWTPQRWERHITERATPLTELERRTLDASRRNVGLYVQGLGNALADDATHLVIEALDEARTYAIVGDDEARNEKLQAIATAAGESIEGRKGNRWLGSRIRDLMEDGARDVLRIATTEAQNVHEAAKAADVAERYGKDATVFKRLSPGACKHCERLYGPANKPRMFKLSELIANGNNFGRKAADWLPTLDAAHPWCACTLVTVPDGYGVDEKGRLVPAKPEPGLDSEPNEETNP